MDMVFSKGRRSLARLFVKKGNSCLDLNNRDIQAIGKTFFKKSLTKRSGVENPFSGAPELLDSLIGYHETLKRHGSAEICGAAERLRGVHGGAP